jgi:hypothetical protein
LEELIYRGVKKLEIASDDPWHEEAGLDLRNLDRIRKVKGEYKGQIEIRFKGQDEPEDVLPIGRAAQLELPVYKHDSEMCREAMSIKDLTIKQDGSVYPCCYGFFQLSGNLIEEDLDVILERALQDKRLALLNGCGIGSLAYYDGASRAVIGRLRKRLGACGLCWAMYGGEDRLKEKYLSSSRKPSRVLV